jgi:PAS domain S-box-containing protein
MKPDRQNKEFLKVLLKAIDNVAEGISIADASEPDLPLVYVNQGFYKITGYSAEEVIGKNCRFLQGPDTNKEEVKKIRDSIKNNTSCVVELENYKKDGTMFWNRLSMVPLFDGKKNLTHYVGIQSDITIEKKLVKEKSELNAMQTTLQTVNDIVFNFMNTLQLVKLHLEEDPSTNSEIIGEFDLALNQTLSKLKQLNALE